MQHIEKLGIKMSQKWENAPVMYTVAQVRFNQILSIESFVPNIQEKLRTIGFPDYKKEIENTFNIAFSQPENNTPVVQAVNRFIFGDINGTSGFTLESNALSFQTTEYDVFDTFLNKFLTVLSVVNDNVNLSFIERVGIRHIDAIIPQPEEALGDYLVPEVLGLTYKLNGNLSHSYTETLSTNEAGGLIARVVIQSANLNLPPELAQTSYPLNSKFSSFNGLHAIIDTDGYSESRMGFDNEVISKKLIDLHEEIAKSFKSVCTPHALKVWQFGVTHE